MRSKCKHHGCKHAQGDVCNCSCGGRYHGKANVVSVTIKREAAYSVSRNKAYKPKLEVEYKPNRKDIEELDIPSITRQAFERIF